MKIQSTYPRLRMKNKLGVAYGRKGGGEGFLERFCETIRGRETT